MVIIHIANIDTTMIAGVQIAVPKMIRAQSQYAKVAFLNTHGDSIDAVQMLRYDEKLEIENFPEPFNKPDIMVFHEVYRFEYIAMYRALNKRNISYVIVPHGCLSKKAQQKKWVKKTIANMVFFNKFIKKARGIQYLSENEKNMSVFKRMPSYVLGNGVSVPKEKITTFSKTNIKFVYIGRLEMRIKGLDLLLAAVKKCESILRKKDATVEIYGPDYEGAHKKLVHMINKLNITDLVCLGKEKTGEDKRDILCSATCFIQTSRTEGLPLGPLEALSYGLPCIVTQGVGLGKIIESYGAGYQCVNTVDGISRSIELFMKNINNIEIMSQSAIRLIEENYDLDVIAKRTVDGYCDMTNQLKG